MSYVKSVQRAIDFIEEHIEENIDPVSIAEEAYISVAQLYRVFYALTGHPVKDYIRKRRMSVAAESLRNSTRTVEEIAWESGFDYYHSFVKAFKKIVGLTPSAYRNAELYFSFEPIALQDQVAYKEDKELAELYPDIKVVRFAPEKVYAYLHISMQEAGMENEAFRIVHEKLRLTQAKGKPKVRIFGYNVDLPDEDGVPRYGYRVFIMAEGEWSADGTFVEESFDGGLYAVRKTAAFPPGIVQEGWNRLLSEWLPKSTFEIGPHQYFEEFVAYSGKVTRMNLYLPVQRKFHCEPVEIVNLAEKTAFYSRGYGARAQELAEQRLIACHESRADKDSRLSRGKYYMSYHYGDKESDEYWWENGVIFNGQGLETLEDLDKKSIGSGVYACCITKTYGLLTGVLDKMHRWVAANDHYRLDEERQWFAEYHLFDGIDVERDSLVKVYIPLK
jgi:AraC-like DNA-binding protein/predicted transcriptional regulator YdeE